MSGMRANGEPVSDVGTRSEVRGSQAAKAALLRARAKTKSAKLPPICETKSATLYNFF